MTDEEFIEAVCDWFADLSEERKAVLTTRVERAIEDIYDEEERQMAGQEILEYAYAKDLIEEDIRKGHVVVVGVDEDGYLMYQEVE